MYEITTFLRKNITTGQKKTVHFDGFVKDFAPTAISWLEGDPTKDAIESVKNAAPLWSPTVFEGDQRAGRNAVETSMLVFDLDRDGQEDGVDVTPVLDHVEALEVAYLLHSTAKTGLCRPGRARLRLVLPLDRAVKPDEYRKLWEVVRSRLELPADSTKVGPESAFFYPRMFAAHRGLYVFSAEVNGRSLAVQAFLASPSPALRQSGSKLLHQSLNSVPANSNGAGMSLEEQLHLHVSRLKDARINKSDTLIRAGTGMGAIYIRSGGKIADIDESWKLAERALKDNVVCLEAVRDWELAAEQFEKAWNYGAACQKAEIIDVFVQRVLGRNWDGTPKRGPKPDPVGLYSELREQYGAVLDGGDFEALTTRLKSFDVSSLSKGEAAALAGALEAGEGVVEGSALNLSRDKYGRVQSNDSNITNILRSVGCYAYDDRSKTSVYVSTPPWSTNVRTYEYIPEHDALHVMNWLAAEWRLTPSIGKVVELVELVARQRAFDPLHLYFEKLETAYFTVESAREFVGGALSRYWGIEDTAMNREMSLRWHLGVLARQYAPGCKMDTALVLVGAQGVGKSSYFREIFPASCADLCFSDYLPTDARDAAVACNRFAVIEFGELAYLSRKNMESVKREMSERVATVRVAYARKAEVLPRRAVLCGTTNELNGFLTDSTGNRRFWPVLVGDHELNLELLRAERDRLWAAVKVLYGAGEGWELSVDVRKALPEAQEAYMVKDPWEEAVENFLLTPPSTEVWGKEGWELLPGQIEGGVWVRVRMSDFAQVLNGGRPFDHTQTRRTGTALRRLGWANYKIRIGNRTANVWEVRRNEAEQVA